MTGDATEAGTSETEPGDTAGFPLQWDFIRGVPAMKFLPPEGPPEIAFAGRSNVGKSSLINAVVAKKGLARTSNTPGRTQELNFFVSEGIPLEIIDMPGYGYAAVSKTKISSWDGLMKDYLRGRAKLLRVYVLIDGRRGVMKVDEEMLDVLDAAAVSYALVLTKKDEVKKGDVERIIAETQGKIAKRPAAYPLVLFTSSHTGEGVADLRAAIAQLLAERGV